MSGEGVTSTHIISRQGSGRSKFWFDGSHNDLKNLGISHAASVLVSGHLAAVQHTNQCLPPITQGTEAAVFLLPQVKVDILRKGIYG